MAESAGEPVPVQEAPISAGSHSPPASSNAPALEIHPPEEENLNADEPHGGSTPTHTKAVVEEDADVEEPSTPVAVAERPLPPEPVEASATLEAETHANGSNHDTVQSTSTSPRRAAPPAEMPKSNGGAPGPQPMSPSRSATTPASAPRLQAHRPSISATSFNDARGHPVSVVLISSALDTIIASKEAKRSAELRDSATHALDMIKSGQGGDRPREIFEPLRLACETKNEKLMVASLDCISKLISYSFFVEDVSPTAHVMDSSSPPASPAPGSSASSAPATLADLVTHTITAAYTETTPDAVSLQIVKALLALVLSTTVLVHHSSLLKAVRTVYNVFLLSTDPVNQMVAQGGLTQMVNHVFSRAKIGVHTPTGGSNSPDSSTPDLIADIQARIARQGVILPRRKSSFSQSGSTPTTPAAVAMPQPRLPADILNNQEIPVPPSETPDETASVGSTAAESTSEASEGEKDEKPSPAEASFKM